MPSCIETKRELNPDIIRLLALLFVLGIHFYTHCNIYNAAYGAIASFLVITVRTLVTTALALFIMLNGYFQREKKLTARYYLGILRLLEMYLVCAVAELIYRHFYLGEAMSARGFLGAIVNFTASEYSWYILLYFGLFLMIPFLNLAYGAISCRGHKRILIMSMFILSALPYSALNVFVNTVAYWWQRLWPISFYFLGAYIGEYRPRPGAKKCAALSLAALLLISLFNFLVYSDASPLSGHAAQAFLYSHESLQNAVLAPLIFLLVLNLDTSRCPDKTRALVSRAAGRVYGAFLFSSVTDSFIYSQLVRLVPEAGARYPFALITLPLSFVSALLISAAAEIPVNAVDKLLRPPLERLVVYLYKKLAPDAPE